MELFIHHLKYVESNYEKDERSFTYFTKDKFLDLTKDLEF